MMVRAPSSTVQGAAHANAWTDRVGAIGIVGEHCRIGGPQPVVLVISKLSRTCMPILDWRDFPASWEKAGNFIGSGLPDPHIASKKPSRSITHNQIPYAPEQGIDWAVAGNLVRSRSSSSLRLHCSLIWSFKRGLSFCIFTSSDQTFSKCDSQLCR